MTLSDLQCDISYSCASVDKISTDVAHRAVPLQKASLFFLWLFFIQFSKILHRGAGNKHS